MRRGLRRFLQEKLPAHWLVFLLWQQCADFCLVYYGVDKDNINSVRTMLKWANQLCECFLSEAVIEGLSTHMESEAREEGTHVAEDTVEAMLLVHESLLTAREFLISLNEIRQEPEQSLPIGEAVAVDALFKCLCELRIKCWSTLCRRAFPKYIQSPLARKCAISLAVQVGERRGEDPDPHQ